MNDDCRSFRHTLERALEGARGAGGLTGLSWHEHLLGCESCRALLEAEEALETLLETLPEPRLPPSLARRVLRRLRAGEESREAALDRLLDRDPAARAPGDLARRVLQGLEPERARPARAEGADARLDALLERARAVHVPAGLPARVLAGLSAAREPRTLARGPRASRPTLLRPRFLLAAAASLTIALTLWQLWPRDEARSRDRELAQGAAGLDPHLLENLDLLEQWDELRGCDVDLLLSTLPAADRLLLEMGGEEGLLVPEKTEGEPARPSKG